MAERPSLVRTSSTKKIFGDVVEENHDAAHRRMSNHFMNKDVKSKTRVSSIRKRSTSDASPGNDDRLSARLPETEDCYPTDAPSENSNPLVVSSGSSGKTSKILMRSSIHDDENSSDMHRATRGACGAGCPGGRRGSCRPGKRAFRGTPCWPQRG
jgi:hypothetical protein